MTIFSRYVLKEVLSSFLVVMLAFSTVLVTVRMLKFTSLIFNKGVEPFQIAKVFIAIFPPFLEIALPLSGLLAALIAVSRLSMDSELIVMRGSGVSLYRLLSPLALFSIVLFVAHIIVSSLLRPAGNQLLQQTLYEIARSRTTAGIDPGVFSQLGTITLYADSIDYDTGKLNRVLIEDRREEAAPKLIHAQRGTLISDDTTRTLTFLLEDGTIHEFVEGSYILTDFSQNQLTTHADDLFSGDEARRGQQVAEMSIAEITSARNELTERLARSDFTSDLRPPSSLELKTNWRLTSESELSRRFNRLTIERDRRILSPLVSLFFPFLGMALGVTAPRHQRSWALSAAVGMGALSFALQFGSQSVATALAENGHIPAALSFILPTLLVAVAAGYGVYIVASEKAHSIADWAVEAVYRLRRLG